MEAEIERLGATFEPRDSFALPRGSRAATELHVARTVCRRAERALWTLQESEPVPDPLLQWANRLSSLLFALALSVNRSEGVPEIAPDYSV